MVVAALARKIFGSSNDRRIKRYQPTIDAINALEAEYEKLSDDELKAKTAEFRKQIEDGKSKDDLLVPAFAAVREAAKRVLGLRHFDVQLIGGMVLNDGAIAEMRTGEGKTLVATLAAYLNALPGKGVHVVTVNDYLANRDAAWMGQVYNFLGLSVGVIIPNLPDPDRREAYAADITYGTNNEFGFDYLRDNMKHAREQMVQRGHNFAIVDEVDSILVDEARTPLIISGPAEDRSELYVKINKFIPQLTEEDYEVDEKARAVTFTDEGIEKIEEMLKADDLMRGESLYDSNNVTIVHHVNSALRAHTLFTKDKDYIVRDGEVVIIDEFTGRMMAGRRFSEGLHQALEAKEGVDIKAENQTMASITFQNYFRLYSTLSGMTGTAATEAEEFMDIYSLDVVTIPTNVDVARQDEEDEIYRTYEDKVSAISKQVKDCQERGQPVLVGTTSIEKSEDLAARLQKIGVKDIKVLNARHHEQEAQIVAYAGVPGAVTIATNMAGRGTDIQLGGNRDMRIANEASGLEGEELEKKVAKIDEEIATLKKQALDAGGLCVIGTERHESRRIDNQLRGRSGRQGDPGLSKFYLSLEDDLMRIFGQGAMRKFVESSMVEGEAIKGSMLSKAIENSQSKVEGRNFDIRKNILKYDDVMNDQRKVIFEQRLELMDDDNVNDTISEMRHDTVDEIMSRSIAPRSYPEQWDVEALQEAAKTYLNVDLPIKDWATEDGMEEEVARDRLIKAADEIVAAKAAQYGPDLMRRAEKQILLSSIDGLWREHLVTLDHLSKVIGWRGLAQRDPLNEYKQEAYDLFQKLLESMRELVTTQLAHIQIQIQQPQPNPALAAAAAMGAAGAQPATADDGTDYSKIELTEEQLRKTRRNDPCPCGSGKKFKHCHGAF